MQTFWVKVEKGLKAASLQDAVAQFRAILKNKEEIAKLMIQEFHKTKNCRCPSCGHQWRQRI